MIFRRASDLMCIICLLAIPGPGGTLPWDKDMQDQPSVKPQESQVSTNGSSVPVGGKEGYPPPKDIIELVRARLEADNLLCHPSGGVGAQHRVLGFCAVYRAGTASHDFRPLLCLRRHLFRYGRHCHRDVLPQEVFEF